MKTKSINKIHWILGLFLALVVAIAIIIAPVFNVDVALAQEVIVEAPPQVQFRVPETFWLDQGGAGSTLLNNAGPDAAGRPITHLPQTQIMAYSNANNLNGVQAEGVVLFDAPGATNLEITARQNNVIVADFGTLSNASGEFFTQTLANGLHLPIPVANNQTSIIEWTATFSLPRVTPVTPNRRFTINAWSVAYAPNSQITGSVGMNRHLLFGAGDPGWMIAEGGAAAFMLGLQTINLQTGTGNWTLDPTMNLLNQMMNMSGEGSGHVSFTEVFDGRDVGSINIGASSRNWFDLPYAAAARDIHMHPGYGSDVSGQYSVPGGARAGARMAGTPGSGTIAYSVIRHNFTADSLAQITNVLVASPNGGWRDVSTIQHVGSMNVDTSRFSNLGQIPGLSFAAFHTWAGGSWLQPSATQFNDRVRYQANTNLNIDNMDQSTWNGAFLDAGDFVSLGSGTANQYRRDFGTEMVEVGLQFSCRGSSVAVAGVGPQLVSLQASFSQMRDLRTLQTVFGSSQVVRGRIGTRTFVRTDFTVNRRDASELRGIVSATRVPNEFLTNNGAGTNNHLRTLAVRLGNPLEGSTSPATPYTPNSPTFGRGVVTPDWVLPVNNITMAGGGINMTAFSAPYFSGEVISVQAPAVQAGK